MGARHENPTPAFSDDPDAAQDFSMIRHGGAGTTPSSSHLGARFSRFKTSAKHFAPGPYSRCVSRFPASLSIPPSQRGSLRFSAECLSNGKLPAKPSQSHGAHNAYWSSGRDG